MIATPSYVRCETFLRSVSPRFISKNSISFSVENVNPPIVYDVSPFTTEIDGANSLWIFLVAALCFPDSTLIRSE